MLFYLLLDVLKNEIKVENNVLDLLHRLHLRGVCQCLCQKIQNSDELILRIIRIKHRLLRHCDLLGRLEILIHPIGCAGR